jgi:regulator of protease activity HflC (stomatin/prohibitin superfamily)
MPLNDLVQLPLKILWAVWRIILAYAQQHPWAVAAALYGLALTFGVTIRSGQRGVLFRWGRAVKELEPGFHWLVPLVHGVKKTPVRSVTIDLPAQKVMTADGLVYDVRVNVIYRVEDATKALTLVDHIESGCRTAIPIIVTEVLRVLDQTQLVDRDSLGRELTERTQTSIARWGLVVEQAGFTTIAPDNSTLHTTQLRSKTMERARALLVLIDGGLDAESALVMIGTERQPVAKSSLRYHLRTVRLHYLRSRPRASALLTATRPGSVRFRPDSTRPAERPRS